MTAIAINYIANPFANFLASCNRFFLTVGYAKAAAELSRQGYHEAAKNCMMHAAELRNK